MKFFNNWPNFGGNLFVEHRLSYIYPDWGEAALGRQRLLDRSVSGHSGGLDSLAAGNVSIGPMNGQPLCSQRQITSLLKSRAKLRAATSSSMP